jgi:hypothetical protein
VRALKAQAAGRVELVRAIDVEAQVAAVRVPRVEKADTLLHGRITDQALNRVAGVTVQLVDAKGEPVPGVKAASTDAQGYYAFVLKPEQAAALADRQLAVAIANDDQTVKPTQAAVSLATGTTFLHELLFNDELSRPAGPSKAPDPTRTPAGAKRARGGKESEMRAWESTPASARAGSRHAQRPDRRHQSLPPGPGQPGGGTCPACRSRPRGSPEPEPMRNPRGQVPQIAI